MNNKEKYGNDVSLLLYQFYFCKDKEKSRYWWDRFLHNNNNKEKIGKIKKISVNVCQKINKIRHR
jgi:hypothetical protein